jgi:hypothetical protein
MRINEGRLRQIIREEARRLLLRESTLDAEELLDAARRLANIGGFFRSSGGSETPIDDIALDFVTQAAEEMGADPEQHTAEIQAAARALLDERDGDLTPVGGREPESYDMEDDQEHLLLFAEEDGFFNDAPTEEDAQAIVDRYVRIHGREPDDPSFEEAHDYPRAYRQELVSFLLDTHIERWREKWYDIESVLDRDLAELLPDVIDEFEGDPESPEFLRLGDNAARLVIAISHMYDWEPSEAFVDEMTRRILERS